MFCHQTVNLRYCPSLLLNFLCINWWSKFSKCLFQTSKQNWYNTHIYTLTQTFYQNVDINQHSITTSFFFPSTVPTDHETADIYWGKGQQLGLHCSVRKVFKKGPTTLTLWKGRWSAADADCQHAGWQPCRRAADRWWQGAEYEAPWRLWGRTSQAERQGGDRTPRGRCQPAGTWS